MAAQVCNCGDDVGTDELEYAAPTGVELEAAESVAARRRAGRRRRGI